MKLKLLEKTHKNNSGNYYGLYECECGNNKEILISNVDSGKTISCGCYKKNKLTKHGLRYSSEYRVWQLMKDRCYNYKNKVFKYYGGKGITVCDKWINSFEEFYSDMGPRPSNQYSINRIDNNKNYCPENCEWSNISQQANNKNSNVYLEYNNKKQTLSAWSRELNIPYNTLSARYKRNMSINKMFNTPPKIIKLKNILSYSRPNLYYIALKLIENNEKYNIDDSIFEFGVYMGSGTECLLNVLNKYHIPHKNIYAIDNFSGIPKDIDDNNTFIKFSEGLYNSQKLVKNPIKYIRNRCKYLNLHIIDKNFKELNKQDVINYKMNPAKLVIIDSDIYSSCIDALEFMFSNRLIKKHTLIYYDEFEISGIRWNEKQAHEEIMSKYKIKSEEIIHYIYNDKDTGNEIRQSVFEIL